MTPQIPIQDFELHKPQIAWTAIVRNIVVLGNYRYRCTVTPIDINEPGGELAEKEVGFFLIDFIGSLYILDTINVNSDPNVIEVEDIFNTGFCPQSGQIAIIYKSVWDGTSPFIAPVKLDKLDKSARDNYQTIEKSILWISQQPLELAYENTNHPSVTYTELYRKIFTNNPKIMLVTPEFDPETGQPTGNELENVSRPRRVMDNGLLVAIEYDLADTPELQSGKIIISR
jgi:hypothetical protein